MTERKIPTPAQRIATARALIAARDSQSVLIRLSYDDHEALLVALGGCPKCDHDEAEGEIYRHCDDCMATVTKIMFVACSYNRDMCHLGTPGCASDHAQGEPCETLPGLTHRSPRPPMKTDLASPRSVVDQGPVTQCPTSAAGRFEDTDHFSASIHTNRYGRLVLHGFCSCGEQVTSCELRHPISQAAAQQRVREDIALRHRCSRGAA